MTNSETHSVDDLASIAQLFNGDTNAGFSVNDASMLAGEFPDREQSEICAAQILTEVFHLFTDTKMEKVKAQVAWGIVNSFHMAAHFVERQEDDKAAQLKDLIAHPDPSEIYAAELEGLQEDCQELENSRTILEAMRDYSASAYLNEIGYPFQPKRGSKVSKSLVASQINAIDFLKAKAQERQEQHKPTGPLVIFSGGNQWEDHELIFMKLDEVKIRIPRMVLCTTAQTKGADKIAAAWAATNNVNLIAFTLNKRFGNAAPFKRNDQMLKLEPVEAVICQGSGIQKNLYEKTIERKIPVSTLNLKDQYPIERRA